MIASRKAELTKLLKDKDNELVLTQVDATTGKTYSSSKLRIFDEVTGGSIRNAKTGKIVEELSMLEALDLYYEI